MRGRSGKFPGRDAFLSAGLCLGRTVVSHQLYNTSAGDASQIGIRPRIPSQYCFLQYGWAVPADAPTFIAGLRTILECIGWAVVISAPTFMALLQLFRGHGWAVPINNAPSVMVRPKIDLISTARPTSFIAPSILVWPHCR